MKIDLNLLLLVFAFLTSTIGSQAFAECPPRKGGFPDCSGGHCSRTSLDQSYNEWCISAGLGGCPIIQREDTRSCFCICSCVAGDTLIKLASGKTKLVSELTEGDDIASPFGNKGVSRVLALTMSDATGFSAVKLFLDTGSEIVVSNNHVFLGIDNNFHSADTLKIGDVLASENHTPIVITKVEQIESFMGMLYNVIINESSRERMDHLLVTNDLVSGDFILQNEIDRALISSN